MRHEGGAWNAEESANSAGIFHRAEYASEQTDKSYKDLMSFPMHGMGKRRRAN
jgi:hypothetical protein